MHIAEMKQGPGGENREPGVAQEHADTETKLEAYGKANWNKNTYLKDLKVT